MLGRNKNNTPKIECGKMKEFIEQEKVTARSYEEAGLHNLANNEKKHLSLLRKKAFDMGCD